MTTLVKRGTARRLGLRDAGRWLRFAELIGSSPSAGEAFKQYQQPLMDAIQRKQEQFAQVWETAMRLAPTGRVWRQDDDEPPLGERISMVTIAGQPLTWTGKRWYWGHGYADVQLHDAWPPDVESGPWTEVLA